MITSETYNSFCAALPVTTHVNQWGGADVWKVGGKVFAIGGWQSAGEPHISFKCTPLSFEILREQPGLRPAPYLAARGGKWIQLYAEPGLAEEDLFAYLCESHQIVAGGLSRRLRAELGLEPVK